MEKPSSQRTCELIQNARHQGGEVLGALLDQYRNYLYLIARTQIDLHLAVRASPSDVVQETFLQAAREFEGFEGTNGPQLLAWLRKILANNIVAAYHRHVTARKRDLRRDRPVEKLAQSIDQSSCFVEQALANSCERPDALLMREEQAAAVADMLARLPQHYREVIILRNLESLSFQEVADRMGRSPAAVRKLWGRAIERLRLPEDAEGDADG